MDVRKYSSLSEKCTPEQLFDFLNPVFKIMNEKLERIGGTILEFVGDCIIVVFNTFGKQRTDIIEILAHTVSSLQRLRVLNALSLQTGVPEIQTGVGIHKGAVALGYLGGLERCHLTVLGNTMNLAARIESSTKDLPGKVLVSASCFDGNPADFWTDPLKVNFSLRDLGKHPMKNIQEPVHLFGLSPRLRYWIDFVPMGFVAYPEKGVVYMDTGGAGEPGIIDVNPLHAHSSCELLHHKPELLLGHLQDTPESQIEFRGHYAPDLDCAATIYAAYDLLGKYPRTEILGLLAAYVSRFDVGDVPAPEGLADSLYGLFAAHQKIVAQHYGDDLTDWLLLAAGLRVIDAAVYAIEANKFGDFANIFRFYPNWFPQERTLIQEDTARYQDDLKQRSHPYTACIKSATEPVRGLWLDHPQSLFYKTWAKNDPAAPGGKGYQFLTIDLSQPGKNRFIIFSYPERHPHLEDLGKLLEQHESLKRKQQGQERPVHPIRPPSDNSDPWYFGQGHAYTILDAPWGGTILTAKEVQEIHESWG